MDLLSAKSHERRTEWFDPISIDSHLLEGWPIQDINRASIVNKNPMDRVIGYCHDYHQNIIKGHYDPPSIFFWKDSTTDSLFATFMGLCREYTSSPCMLLA
jgi:hypothetical protein